MTSDKGPEQQHVKANYIEIINRLVPELYEQTEYNLFGEEEDLAYRVLGRILHAANTLSGIIMAPSSYLFSSNLSYVPYFVPFNKVSRVSPTDFEGHVLAPLNKRFSDFTNVAEFSSFVVTSALPNFHLNNVTENFVSGYSGNVDITASTVSGVQDALLDKLGWVYILNTSGEISDASLTAPSSVLLSGLNDNIFYGQELTETDGVSMLFKWLATNAQGTNTAWTQVAAKYLPEPFTQGSGTFSDNYYASGGQLVSALDTLVRVWVNDDDPGSTYFKDIVDASILGLDVERMENAGPMIKMLKALAYGFYDVQDSIRDIQFLLDVDECPPEFLDYLGRYLGWTFFTDDPDQWRSQLKQAIYLYKAKGTRQALTQAVRMVVPSSVYDPNAETSGLQELWESYFPNLIYYAIKSESPLANNMGKTLETLRVWENLFQTSGLDITVHRDSSNQDNNIRFMVDAILEYLNIKHGFLEIGGKSLSGQDFVIAQQITGRTPKWHYRDRNLAIPPWEENRFYANSRITIPLIQDASTILATPSGSFGLQVSSGFANTWGEFISSSIGVKDQEGMLEVGFGDNNKFTFKASSLDLPPNYPQVVRRGDVESMSLFDYWSSKSSEVHSKFQLSSIDFTRDDFVSVDRKRLGRKGLPTLISIFRQFAPFHALNKIIVGSGIPEPYHSVPWSGTVDIEVLQTIESDGDQWNSSYITSGFPGTSGTGIFSGISVFNPHQNRFVPSAVSRPDVFTNTVSFWSGGGPLGISGTLGNPNSVRTAGRRRNNKYKFTGWANTRRGLNQPIATDFFFSGPWAPKEKWVSGFMPKGFDFSAQEYVTTSGGFSSVYANYLTSSTYFHEYQGSSFYPARNVSGFDGTASSFAATRDVFGSQILRAMTNLLLRKGKHDRRWLDFTDTSFENFKFGAGLNQLYNDYNTKFRRQLRNWVEGEPLQQRKVYAGGFNLLSHVFGPLLFNNDFSIKGALLKNNLDKQAFPSFSPNIISASYPDWSGVVATKAIESEPEIVNTRGVFTTITDGILQGGAYDTYVNALDSFESPNSLYYSNGSLLSGVDFVAPNVNALAVWNSYDNSAYNVDRLSPSGITLIQRTTNTEGPRECMRVRYALNGNANLSYNGDFKYAALDEAASMSLSSIAGWQLCDRVRTPGINTYGANNSKSVAFYNVAYTSGVNYVAASCRGRNNDHAPQTLPLGCKDNPSIVTVISPRSRTTPKNLRHLEPGATIELTYETSADQTNVFWNWALLNRTKSKQYDVTDSDLWIPMSGTALSSQQVNDPTLMSGTYEADKWEYFKETIPVSSVFEKGDDYELWFVLRRTSAANGNGGIRNIDMKIIDASSTMNILNGVQGNKLFPDKMYRIGINARVAQMYDAPKPEEYLLARVVVEQKPFVGNGWQDNMCKAWVYNWDNQFWEESTPQNQRNSKILAGQWKKLLLQTSAVQDDSTPQNQQRFEADFNTYNWRTPLRYGARADGPHLGGYFLSAGYVHDDKSVYYVEIAKPENTGKERGVTLLNVDLMDIEYNEFVDFYTHKDVIDVFDYYDTLANNKSSRDAGDSAATYMTSGGSRAEYMEYWGGNLSATDGVYGFLDNNTGN